YSLSISLKYSETLVAFPIHIGSTPVALGSRVPECPIFFIPNNFLKKLTASWEVIPLGLKKLIIPFILNFPLPFLSLLLLIFLPIQYLHRSYILQLFYDRHR